MGEQKVPGCFYGQLSRENRHKGGVADRLRSILQAEASEIETADRCYIAQAGARGTCRRVQLLVNLQQSAPYLLSCQPSPQVSGGRRNLQLPPALLPTSDSGSVGWTVSQIKKEPFPGLLSGRVNGRASSTWSMRKVKLRSDCRDVAEPYDKV
ncbi:putative beta-glucosidase G [Alternaria alternata]|nr:putative beta-glucosidase G [Alternaria alternata]